MGEKGIEGAGLGDAHAAGLGATSRISGTLLGAVQTTGGSVGSPTAPPPERPSAGEQVAEAVEDVLDPLGVRDLF